MDHAKERFLSLLDDDSIFRFVERAHEIEERTNLYRTKLKAMTQQPVANNYVKPPKTWVENYNHIKTVSPIVGDYLRENPNLSCRALKVIPTLIPNYSEPNSIGELAKLPEVIAQLKQDVIQAMYYFTNIRIACEFLHPPLISDEHAVLQPIWSLQSYAGNQVKMMRDAMLKLSNFYAERANARITMYEHAQCEVIQFNSLRFEQDYADALLLIVDKLYTSYIGLFMRIEKDYGEIVKFKTLKAQKTQDIHMFYQ